MRLYGTPDSARVRESYRQLAPRYDAATRLIRGSRCRAIALLRLAPGETVIDAACGTGAALELLSRSVGPQGRVIGVELSQEMIARARERVERLGLRNVTLVEAPLEEAVIPGPADAVLFSYAHDVLRSPPALDNVFGAMRPGARVAAVGAKLYPRALSLLNFWSRWRIRHYVSTFEGLEAPWSLLAEFVPDFTSVGMILPCSGYVGSGTYPGPRSAARERPSW